MRKKSTFLKTNDCQKTKPEDCTDWILLTRGGNTDTTFEVVVKEQSGKKCKNEIDT